MAYLGKNFPNVVGIHQNCRGDSNEYPQHKVLWRTEENYPLIIFKCLTKLFFCKTWELLISSRIDKFKLKGVIYFQKLYKAKPVLVAPSVKQPPY